MSINGDSRGPLGSAIGVLLDAIGDTFIPINNGSYIPRSFTITNASATMAADAATIGLYTAPAAGGTAIVTPVVATTLTGPTVYKDGILAAATTVFTPVYDSTAGEYGVYVRVAIAGAAGLTCDVHLFGDSIS